MWNKKSPELTPSHWRGALPWVVVGWLIWLALWHDLARLWL